MQSGPHSLEAVIVCPNTIFREGLRRALAGTQYRPVACIESPDELTNCTVKAPSLVIADLGDDLDITLRGVFLLRRIWPSCPLVIMANNGEPGAAATLLGAEVNGYISKQENRDVLTKSLDLTMLGQRVISSALLKTSHADIPGTASPPLVPRQEGLPFRLSLRETRILSHLIEGASNKAIARAIGIKETTVKGHVKAILRKTGLKNRTQAAMWGAQQDYAHAGASHAPADHERPMPASRLSEATQKVLPADRSADQ